MMIHRFSAFPAVALTFAAALSSVAQADTAMLGSSSDTYIRDGRSNDDAGPAAVLESRTLSSAAFVAYIQFDLSGLTIDTITDATLNLAKVAGGRNDDLSAGRFATYGLNDDPNNTLQHWHEANDFDPNDATDGLDFRNVGAEWTNNPADNGVDRSLLTSLDPEDGGVSVTETLVGGTGGTDGTMSVTGADLVSFLQSRYDAGGLVTFLFPLENTPDRGYGIASKEHATADYHPELVLTFTVPEPATGMLFLAAASITLLGRRRTS